MLCAGVLCDSCGAVQVFCMIYDPCLVCRYLLCGSCGAVSVCASICCVIHVIQYGAATASVDSCDTV